MALITCIECGKRFSDRAPACPECGCPTSEMTGVKEEAKVSEVVIQLDKSSEEASKEMYDAVDHAKRTASSADSDFDSASYRIQRMASSQIDLFGGSAVSRVADIAQESKKACDDLYAALQLTLASLDNQCRPLLIYKPEGKAIKEVYYEIKQLNSDSEISNTFTASLNYNDLGDVATRRYAPSIQAKMIEQFWKSEYEKVQAEMNKVEAERKAKEEAIRKEKEEEKRKKIEEFQNAHKEVIDEYALKAKRSVSILSELEKQAFEKKKEEIINKIKEEKTNSQSSIDQDIDLQISKIQAKQSQINNDFMNTVSLYRQNLNEKEALLSQLKIFDIAKKKTLNSEIETLVNKIQTLTLDYKSQTSQYKNEIDNLNTKRSSSIKKEFDAIDQRNPLPKMVEYKKEEAVKPMTIPSKTPLQIANEGVKDAIYEYLLTVDLATISDIVTECPAAADLTNQRVSALVRQLLSEGRVERIEEKRMVYFRAVDGYSSNKTSYVSSNNKKDNIIHLIEDVVKEDNISYKELKSLEKNNIILLDEYQVYGALKYLAVDNKIYCEEKDQDFNIFYIQEEYRKKN